MSPPPDRYRDRGESPEAEETEAQPEGARPTPTPPAGERGEARFTPGTVLAERYRIVAPLGRGGMGEVYRADDLKLGQPVALKFLPGPLAAGPDRLERLYAEVRLGRQVSHPNVCRLYDVGETGGHHFLTMEYVDGEDLASLLRRIGRLPPDKALEIARDLCAGLAAAHDRGVIHRDLKPANVMIDGRGRARITDFGLAVVQAHVAGPEAMSGTPAYMSPEQLEGREVTLRSDLYALGLVFYEMFTGKRLFEASTLAELRGRHREGRPKSLSSSVRDVDPAVERVVLRCLEEDPASRPPSAHAVLAGLPGGDPLQAALAAGETPSPAMVAAAGEVGDLRPAVAWACLAATIVIALGVADSASRSMLIRRVPLPKSPEVLAERAREIAARIGYQDAPADSHAAFDWDEAFLRHVAQSDPSPRRWDRVETVRPAPITFYYRQSPRELVPGSADGRVLRRDPPQTLPGMLEVSLDPQGRLTGFTAVPPARHDGTRTASEPDWSPLLAEAGFDPSQLRPVEPNWSAPVDTDRKAAWEGEYPDQPGVPIRLEAASHRGRLVWFSVFSTWNRPEGPVRRGSAWSALASKVFVVSILVTQMAAILLAVRNLRSVRGDRRGAFRVAAFTFALSLVAGLTRADHPSTLTNENLLLTRLVGQSLFAAGTVWALYLALEPSVRRRWPRTLIAWNRLLEGRWRDPMVGRDVLFGALLGVGVMLLGAFMTHALPKLLGLPPMGPRVTLLTPLNGARHMVWVVVRYLPVAAAQALATFCLLLLLRVLLRRDSLALGGLALFVFAFSFGQISLGENLVLELITGAVFAAVIVGTLFRLGLLGLASACYVSQVLNFAPLTLDFSAWYAQRSLLALLAVGALSVWAFRTSLGGKPLFGSALIDD